MKLVFSSDAWDDYQYWLKQELKLFTRLSDLIDACASHASTRDKNEPLCYLYIIEVLTRRTSANRIIVPP